MLVLSSEEFCRLDSESDGLSSFRDFIADFDPVVIGYIRDPLLFLLSRYRHEVQNGAEKRPLEAFLTAEVRTSDFPSRAEKWLQAFPGRCFFRDYDQLILEKKSIILDFFQSINCQIEIDPAPYHREWKLHPALIDARRLLNCMSIDEYEYKLISDSIFSLGEKLPPMQLHDIVSAIPLQFNDALSAMRASWPDTTQTIASLFRANSRR